MLFEGDEVRGTVEVEVHFREAHAVDASDPGRGEAVGGCDDRDVGPSGEAEVVVGLGDGRVGEEPNEEKPQDACKDVAVQGRYG